MRNDAYSISGLDNVKNWLVNVAPKDAKSITRSTIQAIASEARNDMRSLVPVRTGKLKKTLTAKTKTDRSGENKFVGYVTIKDRRMAYGFIVDRGTKRFRGIHFRRKTIEKINNRSDLLKRAFKKAFEKRARLALKKGRSIYGE